MEKKRLISQCEQIENEYKAKVEMIQEELEMVKTELYRLETEKNQLLRDINTDENINNSFILTLEEYSNKIRILEDERFKLKQDNVEAIENLNKFIYKLEKDLEIKDMEYSYFKSKANELYIKNQSYEDKLKKQEKEYNEKINNIKFENDELDKKLNKIIFEKDFYLKLSEKNKKLLTDIQSELTLRLEEVNEENKSLRNEIAELKLSIKQDNQLNQDYISIPVEDEINNQAEQKENGNSISISTINGLSNQIQTRTNIFLKKFKNPCLIKKSNNKLNQLCVNEENGYTKIENLYIDSEFETKKLKEELSVLLNREKLLLNENSTLKEKIDEMKNVYDIQIKELSIQNDKLNLSKNIAVRKSIVTNQNIFNSDLMTKTGEKSNIEQLNSQIIEKDKIIKIKENEISEINLKYLKLEEKLLMFKIECATLDLKKDEKIASLKKLTKKK